MRKSRFLGHGRLLIASLTLGAVASIGAAWWYYRQQREAITAATQEDLRAIADGKVNQIRNWRRERLGDGNVLAASARMASHVLSLPDRAQADREKLTTLLQQFREAYSYAWAVLIDREGKVVLQSGSAVSDPERMREFSHTAMGSRGATLEDLYWDRLSQRPLMALIVPISGNGAFVLGIDPETALFPTLRVPSGMRQSVEAVLIRRQGKVSVFLSAGNEAARNSLFLRQVDPQLPHPDSATAAGGFFTGFDYRGVAVLRTIRRVPDSPWDVSVKIDVAEIYPPLRRVAWEMGLISVLIGALNGAGVGLIWRNRQAQVQEEQRAQVQRIADETPAFLWSTNESGRASFINRRFADFLGTAEAALSSDSPVYIHPEDAERVKAELFGCIQARTEYSSEFRVQRFDGEYRWMVSRGRPSYSAAGDFIGFVGSTTDLTERRKAEQAAQESAALLQMQNRVLEQIAHGAPLQESLDLLIRTIEASVPPFLGSILLLDDDGVHVRHAVAPSLPEQYVKAVDGEPIGEGAGSCGTAAYRREPVVVEDIAADPLWEGYRDLALTYGLRACWSTPILDEQQRVLGTFALYLKTPGRPSERDWKLIEHATYVARIAILRHRETEALRSSEERLRLAVTGGNIGIWEWNLRHGSFRWSDELKAMLGRTGEERSEVPFDGFLQTLHRDDRERNEAALRRALAKRIDYKEEFRVLLTDDTVRWIAAYGRGEYDAHGAAVRMVGVGIDITEQRRAEEEIQTRDAQLISAQRLAHLGSYEWDHATGRVSGSEELRRMFGLAPEEFGPRIEGYLERVHPDDREFMRTTIEQALRDRKPFALEERIVRPDGEVRTLHSQGKWVFDESGQLVKLVGTCQDITERKRTEQQLLEANTALHSLSARLIHAQEEERTRIARELHDDLSQQIAAVSIAVSNLKRGIPGERDDLRTQSERIQQRAIQLAGAVRRISHELHPAILEHAGLAAALIGYCEEVQELTGIRVTRRTEGTFTGVAAPVALAVYRIAQEALQNVVKHARVDECDVLLERTGGSVLLRVSDGGGGLSGDAENSVKGLGLISMKERARAINGEIRIDGRAGHGTVLTLNAPDGSASQHLTARTAGNSQAV